MPDTRAFACSSVYYPLYQTVGDMSYASHLRSTLTCPQWGIQFRCYRRVAAALLWWLHQAIRPCIGLMIKGNLDQNMLSRRFKYGRRYSSRPSMEINVSRAGDAHGWAGPSDDITHRLCQRSSKEGTGADPYCTMLIHGE